MELKQAIEWAQLYEQNQNVSTSAMAAQVLWDELQRRGPVRASPQVTDALCALKVLADFAYKHGFHELGYDPLNVVERALLSAPPAAETPKNVSFGGIDFVITPAAPQEAKPVAADEDWQTEHKAALNYIGMPDRVIDSLIVHGMSRTDFARAVEFEVLARCSASPQEITPADKDARRVAGWLQYINGEKTQNFARDDSELADIKRIAAIMKPHRDPWSVEYVPVYFNEPEHLQSQPQQVTK